MVEGTRATTDPRVKEFLDYLTIERNRSERTTREYGRDLQVFLEYLQKLGMGLDRVERSALRGYVAHLRTSANAEGLPYHVSSVARMLSALRGFLNYLRREGKITEDLASQLESPSRPKRLPRALTMTETLALLRAADAADKTLRDRLVLNLLYASGIRVSELSGLKISDIDLHDRQFHVIGKRDKERIVPFNETCQRLIGQRISEIKLGPSDFLFSRKPGAAPLTARQIERVVKAYGRLAGITKKVTPHVLRHSYATHFLERGMDIRVIQELLGHSSIATTQVYTAVAQTHKKEAYDKFVPLHHKKRKTT